MTKAARLLAAALFFSPGPARAGPGPLPNPFSGLADQFKTQAGQFLGSLSQCNGDAACERGVASQALTAARTQFDKFQTEHGLPTSAQLRQKLTDQAQKCAGLTGTDQNDCYLKLGQGSLSYAKDQLSAYRQFVPAGLLTPFGDLDAARTSMGAGLRHCTMMQGTDSDRLTCLKDASGQATSLLGSIPL